MKHHPDRFSNQEDKKQAKDKFQLISAAYSVLRDRNVFCLLTRLFLLYYLIAKKRKMYDQSGSG